MSRLMVVSKVVSMVAALVLLGCSGNNPAGSDCSDADGDEYGAGADCLGPDCDESSASCHSGGCCPTLDCVDPDGDGYGVGADCLGPDCDESSAGCHSGGCCSTQACVDPDGDGYGVGADCLGPDCDESSASCHSGDCCPSYGHVLYLNFSGAALHTESGVWGDHAPSNLVHVGWELDGDPMEVPGLLEDVFVDSGHPDRQAVIDDVVAMVEQVLAPFDVQVVTQRPPIDDFTMMVVGGRWGAWLQPEMCSKLGQATLDCEESNPSNVGVVASECLYDNITNHGEDGRIKLAHTILHEAAHTWGLLHSQTPTTSIMCVQCMSHLQSFEWGVGPVVDDGHGTCGNTIQDDVAILLEHLGPSVQRPTVPPPPDTTPPVIDWVLPADGQGVVAQPSACLAASDTSGIQAVFLQAIANLSDGSSVFLGTRAVTQPPYVFDDLTVSGDPSIQIVYRFLVLDNWDNVTERRIQPTYDAGAAPVDCP